MSEENGRGHSGRWQRREKRLHAERHRIKKHGSSVRRVYRDAILKRLKARRKK